VRRNPIDLCGVKQHTASYANGLQLSGALQPVKRRFAYLQKRQHVGARE
jgi:hypothetical protein